jgi:hypothetical protein
VRRAIPLTPELVPAPEPEPSSFRDRLLAALEDPEVAARLLEIAGDAKAPARPLRAAR